MCFGLNSPKNVFGPMFRNLAVGSNYGIISQPHLPLLFFLFQTSKKSVIKRIEEVYNVQQSNTTLTHFPLSSFTLLQTTDPPSSLSDNFNTHDSPSLFFTLHRITLAFHFQRSTSAFFVKVYFWKLLPMEMMPRMLWGNIYVLPIMLYFASDIFRLSFSKW